MITVNDITRAIHEQEYSYLDYDVRFYESQTLYVTFEHTVLGEEDTYINFEVYDFYENDKTCSVEVLISSTINLKYTLHEIDEDQVFDMIIGIYKGYDRP